MGVLLWAARSGRLHTMAADAARALVRERLYAPLVLGEPETAAQVPYELEPLAILLDECMEIVEFRDAERAAEHKALRRAYDEQAAQPPTALAAELEHTQFNYALALDAVAALLGVCQEVTYEGQAAVELEAIARTGRPGELRFTVRDGVMDPLPVIRGLVDGVRESVSVADLAASFHHAVIEATVVAADAAARAAGIGTIGLTGGVFANRLLLDGIRNRLSDRGYDVLTHRLVPCNDGGLALGQAVIAAARLAHEGSGECA